MPKSSSPISDPARASEAETRGARGALRAGRDHEVAAKLRVTEVYVGQGERRRRALVGHTPEAAEREQAHRAPLLALVRAELVTLSMIRSWLQGLDGEQGTTRITRISLAAKQRPHA
jgi:hypothetical protein